MPTDVDQDVDAEEAGHPVKVVGVARHAQDLRDNGPLLIDKNIKLIQLKYTQHVIIIAL